MFIYLSAVKPMNQIKPTTTQEKWPMNLIIVRQAG